MPMALNSFRQPRVANSTDITARQRQVAIVTESNARGRTLSWPRRAWARISGARKKGRKSAVSPLHCMTTRVSAKACRTLRRSICRICASSASVRSGGSRRLAGKRCLSCMHEKIAAMPSEDGHRRPHQVLNMRTSAEALASAARPAQILLSQCSRTMYLEKSCKQASRCNARIS